jgi:DNA invertase Pin-like site-specific DNA recombinase
MKVAIYARVSTDGKGQDTINQLRDLRDFAKRADYEVVEEFVENVSASGKVARPKFEALFLSAYQRKFDLVLFWSLDRFTREGIQETFQYLEKLNNYDVKWKSFTEPYLDTSGFAGEIIIAVMAAIAKQERIRLGERVKAGMQTAKEKGVRFGRKPVTEEGRKRKGKLLPVANVIQISQLKQEGKSLREIAKITGISKDSIARLLSQKAPESLAA